MNSQELLGQIRELDLNPGINFNINRTIKKLLKTIYNHYSNCDLCSNWFTNKKFQEKLLINFSIRLLDSNIEDWVCKDLRPRDINGKIKSSSGKNPQYRLDEAEIELILLKRAIFDNNPEALEAIKKKIESELIDDEKDKLNLVLERLFDSPFDSPTPISNIINSFRNNNFFSLADSNNEHPSETYIPCQFCNEFFAVLNPEDELWLSHEICRGNYHKLNEELNLFLDDKVNSADKLILLEIQKICTFHSWINNKIVFRPIFEYSFSYNDQFMLIEVDLTPDKNSNLFKIIKIVTNEYYFYTIRKVLEDLHSVLPITKSLWARCQFCNVVFDGTPEDCQLKSHTSCRTKNYQINSDFSSYLGDKFEIESKNFLISFQSIYKNFFSWFGNTIIFKNLYNDDYSIKLYLTFDEILMKFKISKIESTTLDFNYILENDYGFKTNLVINYIRSPMRIHKKNYFSCQFCNEKVEEDNWRNEEDEKWYSHTSCRAKIIDINLNLEQFFKEIEDNDRTLLLKIKEYTTDGYYYFLPFFSWNEDKIIFKFPENVGRNNPGELDIYLTFSDSGKFSIKNIKYDDYTEKAIKRLVTDLNRNISLESLR